MSSRLGDASKTETVNREWYDLLYHIKHPLLQLLHASISFDQQSKGKRNFRLIRPYLEQASASFDAIPKVLDYGFGHGCFLLKLPRKCEAFGIEISENAVRNLGAANRLRGRKMHLYLQEDFKTLTAGLTFEFIICSHVLEHVPDDGEIVRLFSEKLAPNGKLLLNLPINEVWLDPKHVRSFTQVSITDLLEAHGLRVEKTWICDRWSAFLLEHEQVRPAKKPLRLALKGMRLLFALLPVTLLDWVERILPDAYREQQILVLASRT
jgi:2-polyprenyl-3-methyl-5-hydroxy-6-metoxy-1,4-benzoquinol methylase